MNKNGQNSQVSNGVWYSNSQSASQCLVFGSPIAPIFSQRLFNYLLIFNLPLSGVFMFNISALNSYWHKVLKFLMTGLKKPDFLLMCILKLLLTILYNLLYIICSSLTVLNYIFFIQFNSNIYYSKVTQITIKEYYESRKKVMIMPNQALRVWLVVIC